VVTLILKWVINHQNWAILRGEHWSYFDCKSVLAPVQLIRGVPSILSSDQRKIWNGKLETVADQTRLDIKLNSAGWNGISRSLRDFKIHFGSKIYFDSYLIHLTFHPFHVSRSFLHHLAQNWNLKTVWQKIISGRKQLSWNIKIDFSRRGDAVVFDGIFCQVWPSRKLCDQKILNGSLLTFFSKKL